MESVDNVISTIRCNNTGAFLDTDALDYKLCTLVLQSSLCCKILYAAS